MGDLSNNQKQQDKGEQEEQAIVAGRGLGKEVEAVESPKVASSEGRGSVEREKRREVGEYVKEIPVRPEIPREVERAGVKHAGPSVPFGAVAKKKAKVNLPLTDDQIAKGLHAHIWQSVRWLAVWCVRQLKKLHIIVKEKHGRLIRV